MDTTSVVPIPTIKAVDFVNRKSVYVYLDDGRVAQLSAEFISAYAVEESAMAGLMEENEEICLDAHGPDEDSAMPAQH